MENEKITSAAPTGLLYGLYGALAMVVYSIVSALAGSMMMSIMGSIIAFVAVFCIIIGTMVFAIRHHRDTLQAGRITWLKAFTICVLISFVISLISGIFMYIYTAYIDTSYLIGIIEKSQELFEKLGMPEDAIEKAMVDMKKNATPFGMFRQNINSNLIMGAIVGVIVASVMQKNEDSPFVKQH